MVFAAPNVMPRWFLAAALLLVAGCSNDSTTMPTTPAPLNLTGTWNGTVTFENVASRMTWVLTQSGAAVTGPVTVALPSGTVLLNGTLTGTLTGTSLDYAIAVNTGGIPQQPSCVGQLKGTMTATPTTLVGPLGVTSTNCTVQITTETVTLSKQ